MQRHVLGFAIAIVFSAAGLAAGQDVALKAKAKAVPGSVVANGEAPKSPYVTMGIDGRPSTLVGCAGGTFYNVHPLGTAPAGTRVRIDITSGAGIDPVATATMTQMGSPAPGGTTRVNFASDDDSGGNLDPRLEFTLSYDSNVVLSVGSFDGTFGCYWVKVEVTVP